MTDRFFASCKDFHKVPYIYDVCNTTGVRVRLWDADKDDHKAYKARYMADIP